MAKDIFEFWAQAKPTDRTHPADRYVLDRVQHGFDLRCLPACFDGPLRTAKVVLLYLSPGFAESDVLEAESEEGQARYAWRRTGDAPLRDQGEGWVWWSSRTKVFGPWQELQHKLAIFNISPYHSEKFTHDHVLAALPSCRVSLDWAQNVLFPQAERGERVVVCMRSARYWGLGKEPRYGKSLFAPAVNRGGYMLREGDETANRDDVVAAVREALARS